MVYIYTGQENYTCHIDGGQVDMRKSDVLTILWAGIKFLIYPVLSY